MATQQDFYDEANKWNNIFLTWVWWSWKTFALSKWKEETKWKKILTCSPTWIAAIQAWGQTIHSMFKLFGNNYHVINSWKINWSIIDTLIIDEISMVSCELFDYIDKYLRKMLKKKEPFWWIQIICVGDLSQLPPVYNFNEDWVKDKYEKLIIDLWWVEFNRSKTFAKAHFKTINLTVNFRSVDDKLNNILNDIREWEINSIHWFKSKGYTKLDYDNYTHLMPYNCMVDKFNSNMLNSIKWKEYKYKSKITWEFNTNNVLANDELILKVWVKVMIVKNLKCWLVNWDSWYVTEIVWNNITFLSDRLWWEFIINHETWFNISYNESWDEEILWTFKQIPLKLNYAISIHKSQGLTLDKVMFHYNPRLSKELCYVACSRVRDYESLYLIK